jgi:hypothetical protein
MSYIVIIIKTIDVNTLLHRHQIFGKLTLTLSYQDILLKKNEKTLRLRRHEAKCCLDKYFSYKLLRFKTFTP